MAGVKYRSVLVQISLYESVLLSVACAGYGKGMQPCNSRRHYVNSADSMLLVLGVAHVCI